MRKEDREVSLSLCVCPESLCQDLNLRNPFVLYFTKDLTAPVCLSFFFETEDVHQIEVRLSHYRCELFLVFESCVVLQLKQ